MFKKLKDKLAEEVKSSPQRIQQFAQVAQAVVTSASSSISDITNNDLFSIGDNENSYKGPVANNQQNKFQEISLVEHRSLQSAPDTPDLSSTHEEQSRQRRLSNSSFASDISFRLPTYESPSMYHLQSDIDVSASEAEDRGFGGGTVNLDRVTKEQLYAAYRRTQDRFTKYKTQYADLARHYKLLERENAKARNVLVETQDKALRRISELREQCTLEQSAKAHLENALRIEIEERNMKIDTLNTKLNLLQDNKERNNDPNLDVTEIDSSSHLIDLSFDDKQVTPKQESLTLEASVLSNKVSKMEHLLNKYKESLKNSKEKNSQIINEMKVLSADLENKKKENEELKASNTNLINARQKIDELNAIIEKMQDTYKDLELNKNKEILILKQDLEQAEIKLTQLNSKIETLSKREEEYAISLAENKLSIHKELEAKEAEIKSLKDNLSGSQNEIQSLNIVINDYKKSISVFEEEKSKFNININELNLSKTKIKELELQIEDFTKKVQLLENAKGKIDEEYKCLQLQLKQETAEKLAMVDRNTYLEDRNSQLSDDSLKKSLQIQTLESELKKLYHNKENQVFKNDKEISETIEEGNNWKTKFIQLESEMQEEREELVKLQAEIEKLLCNHESIQAENFELQTQLQKKNLKTKELCHSILCLVKVFHQNIHMLKKETKMSLDEINHQVQKMVKNSLGTILNLYSEAEKKNKELSLDIETLQKEVKNICDISERTKSELSLKTQQCEDFQAKLEQRNCLSNDLQNITAENVNLLENLKAKSKMIEELTEQIKHIKELELSKEKDMEGFLKTIEELKKLKINLANENAELIDSNKKIVVHNEILSQKINESEQYSKELSKENENLLKQLENVVNRNSDSETKHQSLINRLNELETKNNELLSKQILLTDENKALQDAKVAVEKVYDNLKIEQNELNTKYSSLEIEKQKLLCNIKDMIEENSIISSEKGSIIEELNKFKDSNVYLQEKVNILRKQNEDYIKQVEVLKNENSILTNKLEDYERNIVHIQELEGNIKVLSRENETLKHQSESICKNVKELEIDMLQLRNSHVEIEKEKDYLNSIINQIESSKQNSKEMNKTMTVETQTCNDHTIEENKLNKSVSLKELTHQSSQTYDNVLQEENVYKDMNNSRIQSGQLDNCFKNEENTLVEEENRRLRSDIEGLQTYLTKISKENSLLNDKLREAITSCDSFTEQSEISQYDIEKLRNEIQDGKNKIDNLTRENILLAEENLELKDQINSQSYKLPSLQEPSDNEENISDIKKNYYSVVESKDNLEKRVKELEQMNISINSNMQEMLANNEKLRLSNDKLERRLDEALVSLRHLHSLEENTELEYLRNILYEYLTGSGTHSVTLAKVLSAVVKFNESQTEQVLQKERERQGLLRQLGII